MKECVVYHWWSYDDDEVPLRNQRTPIIASIATLRSRNPSIPIYVLEWDGFQVDFGDLPERLGFKVVPYKFHLESYSDVEKWRNLSRLFDIHRFSQTIEEDVIIYSDTDIFWLKDPLPLDQDLSRFNFNGYNSGFFYYDKNKIDPKFFEIFESYVITALNDEAFRYITWQYSEQSHTYFVLDEAILCYMWHKMPHLFNRLKLKEHFTIRDIDPYNLDFSEVKMVHANSISVQNQFVNMPVKVDYSRGILPLIGNEFYHLLDSIIPLNEMYSQEEIDFYSIRRIDLLDPEFVKIMMNHKEKSGLFNLMKSIESYHQAKRLH